MLNSTLSEEKWLLQTQNTLYFHHNVPISVYQVPNFISVVNPRAYVPQLIALGPYHNLRPELYHMERSKIEVIKYYWNSDQINLVVKKLKENAPKIRACYHKYLDLSDDTLALMLTIDGLFLIYLLRKDLSGFPDDASVFRDVMMLENQIPMVLMMEIVRIISLTNNDDVNLFFLMREFCESQSPFLVQPSQKVLEVTEVHHLLDLLHKMIIVDESNDKTRRKLGGFSIPPCSPLLSPQASMSIEIDTISDQLAENIREIVASEVLSSIVPIQLVTTLPWGMIWRLFGHSYGSKEVINNPLVEEIEIPSVSQLSKMAGIMFEPKDGGTIETYFDKMTGTLYLPVITLNENSEVVLRNLEAYEIATSEVSLVAQYLDIMSGIIDTKEDALILRSAGIIRGSLKNTQVADLFNGINKSSHKVNDYDTASEVNNYYQHKRKVRAYKFVKKYVYKSWKLLTVVSTLVLFLILIFQSFCNVYSCK